MNTNSLITRAAVALCAAATLLSASSCSDTECPNYWDEHYGPYEPTPFVAKPRYVWVNAVANSFNVFNDKDGIREYVDKAVGAGFTDIVVDVRPYDGDVLFKTDRADLTKGVWWWHTDRETGQSGYDFCEYQHLFDYLDAWIEAGHAAGVRIHASFNTMQGGAKDYRGNASGMLYRDPSKHDWATTLNMPDNVADDGWIDDEGGLMNMLDITWINSEVFMNPHNPEVQDFIIGLVRDLVTNYPDLDGVILDGCRFLDYRSDFSDLTKEKFEEFLGETVEKWPDDVMSYKATAAPTSDYPKYYKEWLEFRAKTMHDIVERASVEAHAANPSIQFGCYVGAWYSTYYQCGVNWASPNYDPVTEPAFQSWATNTYKNTGYADNLDILILGCYTTCDNLYGSYEWSAQGFALNGKARTMGDCPLVIGGPDFNNWPTAQTGYVFADRTEGADYYHAQATDVVDACINSCDGFFLFDIIHLINSPAYFDDIKAGIDKYLAKGEGTSQSDN